MWKTINEFPNYEVSRDGIVRRINNKRIITKFTWKGKLGHNYECVKLHKDGQSKSRMVHRLIAIAFIDNPLNKRFIDHIDRNTLNNQIDNLRWCSTSENSYNAKMPSHNKTSKQKGVSKAQTKGKWRARIYQNGKEIYIGTYPSIKEAKDAYNKKAVEVMGEFFYSG